MKSYREQFEEIWPVPDGISYANGLCGYAPYEFSDRLVYLAIEHNARLETFSRCLETTDVYVSLVDDLVKEIESCYSQLRMAIAGDLDRFYVSPILGRAKQILVSNGLEVMNK